MTTHEGIDLRVIGYPTVVLLGGSIATQQQADRAIALLEALKYFVRDDRDDHQFPDEGL